MSDLHETHRWEDRTIFDVPVAVCQDCHVQGWDDEARAFAPCPGPPVKRKTPAKKVEESCGYRAESLDDPGHQHACEGGIHPEKMHYCDDCGRWFG